MEDNKKITGAENQDDFRAPTKGRRLPRAVADTKSGIITGTADISGSPEQVFNALTTNEIEQWWKWDGQYFQRDWKSKVEVCGPWSVSVELIDGNSVQAWGEFCELNFPYKLVMTRRFDKHPFLGERETTISYDFEATAEGTFVTLRDSGFIGRAQAALGNAEIWEHVLGWLDAYLAQKEFRLNLKCKTCI